MRIRFVGSGDAFGSGGRAQTCISVTSADHHLLVDCGTTSLVALKAQGLDPGSVDAVTVTHLHGDHFGGLPFLILDGQFNRRTRPLTVCGPPGTEMRLAQTMEQLFPGSSQVARRFDVQVLEFTPDAAPTQVGPVAVQAWSVIHECGAPPVALRVDDGRMRFAYSGDTQWTPALCAVADGVDLFAVEAYTYDKPVRYHLAYATLREHLNELRANQIILTHMSAAMLDRLGDAELPAAHDGMTIEL